MLKSLHTLIVLSLFTALVGVSCQKQNEELSATAKTAAADNKVL